MKAISYIEEKLRKNKIVILDGATGTELERRGVPMHGKVWSAEALFSHPEIVQTIHEDYIHAGADIVTVNSFSAARHMLIAAALTGEFARLNKDAVRLALQARDRVADRPVAIAGSIAPTTFCTDPDKCYPPLSEAYLWYEEQASLLAESGVDLLIVEMIEDIIQGSLAVRAAAATGLPVWLGFSCQRNAAGSIMLWERNDTLEDGINAIAPLGGSAAFIMHTEIEDATDAFQILRQNWTNDLATYSVKAGMKNKKLKRRTTHDIELSPSHLSRSSGLGIYAHSGLFVMPSWQFNDIVSPSAYADQAEKWIQMGARIIGGCCGIGPDHIRELYNRFGS